MAADLHQYTFSITPSLEADLEKAKSDHYKNMTDNEMIKDLIARGLAAARCKDEPETDVIQT